MAFMMPVMKKNYALYGKQQQRRTASEPDGGRIAATNSGAHGGHPRRRVKSEGPSLSTSPAAVMSGADAMNAALQHRTKPIGMRRGRGSAPILAPSASLQPHIVTGPSTAPTGNSPAPKFTINNSSPSRSTSSSSTSSGSTSNLGRFHTKLVARLRRSLRLKDPEPTTS
ncbi:unnamed protein product [Allacma fusca]|uniref:Uncharacterized protein n=1 Tax=Allacma fusca TaxID=39272 RepID=A0A8J2LRV6_9HEXA|nr:unnamed protein product [Allacma fusca]